MDPVKIVDNLLTVLTINSMHSFKDGGLRKAQDELQTYPYILDALRYLERAYKEGRGITYAHAEWIDRLNKEERKNAGNTK